VKHLTWQLRLADSSSGLILKNCIDLLVLNDVPSKEHPGIKLPWDCRQEFGKPSGISGDIIGKYERDEMKPSIDTAKKLADALEVSLDYLVGDAELKVLDKKTLQRIQDIEKLPEDERKVIYKVLDSLLRDAKAKQAYA
jgi:transcriptional regulator with XRE-family HTH domain